MDGLAKLGIDLYNILIYIGGTGILVAVLAKLLYNPVNGYIEKRQKTIADKIQEADKIQKDFSTKLAEMEKAKEEAQAELKAELEKMQSFVSTKRAELVEEMEAERAKVMEKANQEISDKKAALLKDAEQDILKLMQKIVLEVVQNKVPAEVVETSVKEAWTNTQK